MTELYIDGQKVVLPEDFTTQIISENPFYTKRGDYSFDISLSLLNATNARIYKHRNRTNALIDKSELRKAVLKVDNVDILIGSERIDIVTDEKAEIQIVAQNSELNFVAGEERKVRDLDLGKADKNNLSMSFDSVYPEVDCHLLEYYAGEGGNIGNKMDMWVNTENVRFTTSRFNTNTVQPYFCFIIRKTIEALGYTLIYNALEEHSYLKNAYIVHGILTYEYAKMLPDWTVKEFLSKIEETFDGIFLVDSENKEVRFFHNHQADLNVKTESLTTVDEYEQETNEDNRLNARIANIEYNLPSDEYCKYMRLADSVLEEITDTNKVVVSSYNELRSTVDNDISRKDFSKIYVLGNDWFVAFDDVQHKYPKKVNSFKPLMNNTESTETDIDLEIIPASMSYYAKLPSYTGAASGGDYEHKYTMKYFMQIPIAESYDPVPVRTVPSGTPDRYGTNIQDLIESGKESVVIPSKISLAIYDGRKNMTIESNPNNDPLPLQALGPISWVECLAEYHELSKEETLFGDRGKDPFRLHNMNTEIYSKAKPIDTTMLYKFDFLYDKKIDVRSNFIIKNREYVCHKIERNLTIDGFTRIATGYFYPKD